MAFGKGKKSGKGGTLIESPKSRSERRAQEKKNARNLDKVDLALDNTIKKYFGGDGLDGGKLSFFHLWRRVVLDWLSRGKSLYGPYRDYNFYANSQSLYSGKDNVTFMFSIDGLPKELPHAYKDVIRREARPGVRISFISTFEKTQIQWDSAQMKSRLRTWRNIDDEIENVDEYNYRENIKALDSNQWRKESLLYLSDADVRRSRKLFRFRTLMLVSGTRGENFDKTVFEVSNLCKSFGIKITRVSTDIDKFLRTFSPFSLELQPEVMKEVGSNTIPDELLSRFNSYDQGKVGYGGVYWGTDIFSGFPVYKEVKRESTDAENILITAETGGGKSYFVKGILMQLLSSKFFNGTIMDIEGFEYTPLLKFVSRGDSCVLLNMAEGQGAYFDPVEIVMTGDESLDEDSLSMSKSYTIAIFKVLLGKNLAENDWADIIINDAVAKTYSDAGVTNDIETWGNSKDLTLFDVYDSIKEMYQESIDESGLDSSSRGTYAEKDLLDEYKTNEGYRDALDMVVAKTSRYFEDFENGGTRSDVFSQKVTIDEVRDAKLVVCSFGMAGKAANTVDPVQMGLTQLFAANISHLRSLFSKAVGKYNFKLWEEFQRWGGFPGSEQTIGVALTGGRKLGDVNIIVTNAVSELLNTDRFKLFENLTSVAIGAIGDSKVRKELCDRLSINNMLPELDQIVLEKGDSKEFSNKGQAKSMYDKAFLVHLDGAVSSITRMEMPHDLSESPIFRTGVDVASGKISVEEYNNAMLEDWDDYSLYEDEGYY